MNDKQAMGLNKGSGIPMAGAPARPIRRRLMMPLAAALLLLVVGGGVLLVKQQEDSLNRSIRAALEYASSDLALLVEEQSQTLDALAQVLLRDAGLRAALKARDRERLLADYGPVFSKLRTDYGLTHFYFVGPDRVCLLRVHKPEKHGDRIDRYTMREAERTGRTVAGLELGPLGIFTLRSVQPVYDGGALIGYLELGKEIEDILATLHKTNGIAIALAIHKGAVDRADWEAGMKMLGREADWDRFPADVLIYSSEAQFPAEGERFVGEQGHVHGDVAAETAFGGRLWRVMTNPLKDVSGEEVGRLIMMLDITGEQAAHSRLLHVGIGGALAILAGLLGSLFVLLRRVDQGIVMQYAELRETRDYLENLLNYANAPIIVWDDRYRITRFNRVFERLTGRDAGEVLGQDLDILFPETSRQASLNFIRSTTGERWDTVEIEIANRGGGIQTLLWNSAALYAADGKTVVATIAQGHDITERKKAEDALRKSDEFNRYILDSIHEAFVIIDPQYRIISANRAFCEKLNLPEREIIGRKCHEVSHHLDKPCFLAGEDCAPKHTFETGGKHHALHVHQDHAGNRSYEQTKSYPLRNTSGTVTAVIETIVDISEQKKLEEQLRHAQKMEAIGTLAGGIAHDFNNILNVIMGYGGLVLDKMAPDSPSREEMHEVLAAAERAASLTKRLLVFSRKQVVEMNPVEVNGIITGVQKMLRRVIGEDIELQVTLADRRLLVMADTGQIEQVLMNLVTNARSVMPKGGHLTITTETAQMDDADVTAYGYGKPGEYAVMTVADTGKGMDAETQKKIFEPFFTTKGIGEGTGLGLAISYGIIKQHNGYIQCNSEPGKGTIFKIYLPLIEGMAAPGKMVEAPGAAKGGTEAILVAEDDPSLRNLTRIVLESFGYSVIIAEDGEEAVAKFGENRDTIKLVILDLVMPKKSGKEAYEEIKKASPGTRTIFLSGYTTDMIKRMEVEGGLELLRKPYAQNDLLRKVREVLDR